MQISRNGGLWHRVGGLKNALRKSAGVRLGCYVDQRCPYQGRFAELRVWNVARTEAEIQFDMHRRLAGDEAGLVGYWPLDDGAGATARDKTANANHGTIHGATWEQSEIPIVVPVSSSWATGLEDYGHWWRWRQTLAQEPRQSQQSFRRGRIWT